MCLIWCIIIRKRKAAKRFPTEQQFLIPDQNQLSPPYLPYTVPKIVQTPVHESRSSAYMSHLPLVAERYYHSDSVRSYANSARSEPVLSQANVFDDRLISRALPKLKEPHSRSGSQLYFNYKQSSRPSSRASSLRSEDFDNYQKDNAIQSRDVYFHSSLMNTEFTTPGDKGKEFVPDDHIVSYDQETDDKNSRGTSPKGALIVSLFYNIDSSELNVVVKQAIDLPLQDRREEDLDIYVNFCLVPEDFYWQRTASMLQTRNPVFNQTFQIADILHHKLRQYTLCFLVMDASSFQETLIGKVMIPLSELRGGVQVEMCKELGD